MDNNLPINPTNQTNQAPVSQQPEIQVAQPPAVTVTAPEKKGMKNTFLLIVFLILSVIIALFVYILFTNKQSNLPSTTPLLPSETTVPKQTTQQEVDSIDVGSVDADMQDIDKDLEAL